MESLAPGLAFSMMLFAFVTSITPGPNNMMLLASGVNFGFVATLRHLAGVSIGLVVILLLAGFGLQQMLNGFPWIYGVMKWLGAGYLVYLAWRISQSGAPESGPQRKEAKPLGFIGAALFQWVNPKVWVMVFGFYSAYVPADAGWTVVIASSMLFGAVNLPCVGSWALLGEKIKAFLSHVNRRRAFNHVMAALLIGSIVTTW